jgi:hypothetical protein
LAEAFFALRCEPDPGAPSVGSAATGPYVTDKGFEGEERTIGAGSISTERASSARPDETGAKGEWPKRLSGVGRRASAPDRGETVYEKLHDAFGLRGERAHELQGLRARLAARVALHNFCMWLNEHLGRSRPSFVDSLGW